MSRHLVVGTPTAAYPIRGASFPVDFDWPTCRRIRLAFAFLSYAGLQALLKAADVPEPGIEDVQTDWIVGLSHGITEPRALKEIRALPHARLWLFSPDGGVSRRSLQVPPMMHGKIIATEAEDDATLLAVIAGSANLTGAAVGRTPRNFEAGLAIANSEVALNEDRAAFDAWWESLRRRSLSATEALIDRYADSRRTFLATRRRVLDQVELDPPDLDDVGRARFMWIETGDMSGGPVARDRYQMELNQFLAGFFRALPANAPVRINIELPGGHHANATLSLRTRHHFVDLWRLTLPHPRRFQLAYRNRVMRFERIPHGAAFTYRIEIADLNSRTSTAWRNMANRNGHLGRTGRPGVVDGREWGFYS